MFLLMLFLHFYGVDNNCILFADDGWLTAAGWNHPKSICWVSWPVRGRFSASSRWWLLLRPGSHRSKPADIKQAVPIIQPVYSAFSSVSTKSHALPLWPQTRANLSSAADFNANKASCPRLWICYSPCVRTWDGSRWANTTNFHK